MIRPSLLNVLSVRPMYELPVVHLPGIQLIFVSPVASCRIQVVRVSLVLFEDLLVVCL